MKIILVRLEYFKLEQSLKVLWCRAWDLSWIANSSDPHKRFWSAVSGLGNYAVYKRFAVQTLLWLSLEILIQNKSRARRHQRYLLVEFLKWKSKLEDNETGNQISKPRFKIMGNVLLKHIQKNGQTYYTVYYSQSLCNFVTYSLS